MKIDIEFDYRSDSNGKDPDLYSPTLKQHHKLLWAKPLPSGQIFSLEEDLGHYLVHRSELGEFSLSSDTISNSLRHQKGMKEIIDLVPSDQLDAFQALGATAGAVTLFPGKKVDGGLTINVARGFIRSIGDRFDLTLECIRRHYLGESSPLGSTFDRYASFFDLFGDFNGYVEFFLLQDLVVQDSVRFFLPFDGNFASKAHPSNLAEYQRYMASTMDFVEARRRRIARE